ncbi:serine threonine kinase fnkB [Fusarium subglutinans]|uniref:Serine threonine kinase fnkB n=1 Tax=Gibberella subglutinans TaxID=42677 RepID=A0A8H5V506_GIBSU|nr:serine threonine kinase fnkB [Fusarium subglutinans]KAF5611237.1 serine threonine kinase fnkB [Fusarium subglutinans]
MKTHAEAPPCGYEVGDVLQLQILQTNTDVLSQNETVSVRISEFLTCTMATVVRVTFDTGDCAVLKLYDRRFGSGLRDCGYENFPYCDLSKAAFHGFIERGAMGPFLEELDEEDETSDLVPRTTSCIREGPDGVARFEALIWRYADKHFKTEAEAYNRMQDLQGVHIPKLHVVVRLVPDEENTLDSEYLNIHGILLESLAGHSLDDLIHAPSAPKSNSEWLSIVQRAVDSAHVINKHGIILDDSAPRNVVFDETTRQVLHVDFAQCFFKDTMFKAWCWDTDAAD